jgi:DNA-binding CsgD family transcriptional regulator
MRRYVELTPAIPLVVANPGITILATRFALPCSQQGLHRSAFYREVMRRQGWRHAAALCFWGRAGAPFPMFVLTLCRSEGRPDFSDADLAALAELHPFLAPAVGRAYEMSAAPVAASGRAASRRSRTARLLGALTRSEREVALVVSEGVSNAEAAERLGKTVHAVKFLLHRIYDKLGVTNRTRLVLLLHGGFQHRDQNSARVLRRAASAGLRRPRSADS